jgi:hypothetical protein
VGWLDGVCVFGLWTLATRVRVKSTTPMWLIMRVSTSMYVLVEIDERTIDDGQGVHESRKDNSTCQLLFVMLLNYK